MNKLLNFIYELFHPKKHETFGVYGFEEGSTDDATLLRCKNCEEYIEDRALGQCYEKPHGKWKPVSNHWKNYVKTNVLWEGKKEINIEKYIYYKFNEQIKWRERRYGIPLSELQKIKAARAISHEVYPIEIYWGERGHWRRERFRREILKSVDVEYIMK